MNTIKILPFSKIYFLLIFCFFFQTIHAQQWKTLNDKVLTAIHDGVYQTALQDALLAQEVAIKEFNTRHPNYVCSLHNLATAYHKLGQNDEARSLYLQSIKIAAGKIGKEHEVFAIGLCPPVVRIAH